VAVTVGSRGRPPRTTGAPRAAGPAADAVPWHALSAAEACARLRVDPRRGLSAAEAAARLEASGANRLEEARPEPAWRLFVAQLQDLMVLVLLGAAATAFLLGEVADALVVLVVVAVNATLGFVQERRAEAALRALRRLTAPTATVRRDGREVEVPAEAVVPGDVLVLHAGDRVAADARLVEAASLATEESAITGESHPVTKSVAAVGDPDLGPGDRRSLVFQGTHVVRGRGAAVVVATGMETEVGRIAHLLTVAGEGRTPLERRLDHLGRWLVLGCVVVSAVVVAAGVLQGEPPYAMFLAGVSLAVAAIPEGLPAIVTIALALGVQRMITRHAVVRRLPAVETLGCATVVCADKTGTMTQNRMSAVALYAGGCRYRVGADGLRREGGPEDGARDGVATPPAAGAAVRAALLCNDAPPDGAAGDPTEVALLGLGPAAGLGVAALRRAYPRVAEVPFEAERRRMAVVCRGPDGRLAVFVKGALEEVLSRSVWVRTDRGREVLDLRWTLAIRREGEALAARGLRVLALAERSDLVSLAGDLERELTFCGLVGLADPPRPEVPEAVRRCQQAGVRVVMITGDHALTARAVAAEIGLLRPGDRVLTGAELAVLGDRELEAVVEGVRVFARVSPADKLRVVRALRARGHVVAMTGDGVNDAPAVKEADIGVAMGAGGTDVTREASALVLLDDHFATIVAAIEEGRAIYDNIRKFVRYLLACNTGEVLVMLAATLLGLPLPLLPLQLLLVNLVTDGLPALALGLDPPAADVMRRPPRPPAESLFAGGLGHRIALRGALIGAATLAAWAAVRGLGGGLAAARTAATATLVVSQLLHAFDARGARGGLGPGGWTGNRALLLAVASSFGILLAVVYVPGPRQLFGFVPLGLQAWAAVLAAAALTALLAAGAEAMRRLWVRRTAVVRVARPGAGSRGRG
jgi:Ca2+-transporting ATPase